MMLNEDVNTDLSLRFFAIDDAFSRLHNGAQLPFRKDRVGQYGGDIIETSGFI